MPVMIFVERRPRSEGTTSSPVTSCAAANCITSTIALKKPMSSPGSEPDLTTPGESGCTCCAGGPSQALKSTLIALPAMNPRQRSTFTAQRAASNCRFL